MLEKHRAQHVGAQRRLGLQRLARVQPASLPSLEQLGFLRREGGPQALLGAVLDIQAAVLLDPGHDLRKHG